MCVRAIGEKPGRWWAFREVVRVMGFASWLFYTLRLDWVEGWWTYLRNRSFYEWQDYKLSCVISHATGGRMSYSTYDIETIRAQIDEYNSESIDAAIEEAVSEGWLKRTEEGKYL